MRAFARAAAYEGRDLEQANESSEEGTVVSKSEGGLWRGVSSGFEGSNTLRRFLTLIQRVVFSLERKWKSEL